MSQYDLEAVHRLPFATPEKSDRGPLRGIVAGTLVTAR